MATQIVTHYGYFPVQLGVSSRRSRVGVGGVREDLDPETWLLQLGVAVDPCQHQIGHHHYTRQTSAAL
jgi:hypothetical protein